MCANRVANSAQQDALFYFVKNSYPRRAAVREVGNFMPFMRSRSVVEVHRDRMKASATPRTRAALQTSDPGDDVLTPRVLCRVVCLTTPKPAQVIRDFCAPFALRLKAVRASSMKSSNRFHTATTAAALALHVPNFTTSCYGLTIDASTPGSTTSCVSFRMPAAGIEPALSGF